MNREKKIKNDLMDFVDLYRLYIEGFKKNEVIRKNLVERVNNLIKENIDPIVILNKCGIYNYTYLDLMMDFGLDKSFRQVLDFAGVENKHIMVWVGTWLCSVLGIDE